MTLSRWMLVAPRWARWLVNASVTAVMSTAFAALFFPQFPTTTAWLWKAGAGLAVAATLAYAQPPTPPPGWAGPTAAAASHPAELAIVNVHFARERARRGDRDGAIPLMRAALDDLVREGKVLAWGIPATGVLVETLLERGSDGDVAEAEAAIERLAAAPADDGLVVRDIWLLRLRAFLARARGDEAGYRDFADRYCDMATTLGFDGHIAWAEAMP